MLWIAFLLILSVSTEAFFFGRDQSNWNGLKVTFGLNPFSSFRNVPRTRSSAQSGGWVSISSGAGCDENPHFKGERYVKDNDMGVILIFDPAGYIAGIQIGFPQGYRPNPNNYPTRQLINAPFVLDNGTFYLTAYFVNPDTLCRGRTATSFREDGTGTGLWIQNGSNPVTNSIQIPMTQAEADASSWTKGNCFYSMGVHYWYKTKKDMNCDDFFPVFLLYNDGVLNAFGWALGMDLNTDFSRRVEHPAKSSYWMFMTPVPDCLYNIGTLTTLHIYLTNSATANTC